MLHTTVSVIANPVHKSYLGVMRWIPSLCHQVIYIVSAMFKAYAVSPFGSASSIDASIPEAVMFIRVSLAGPPAHSRAVCSLLSVSLRHNCLPP